MDWGPCHGDGYLIVLIIGMHLIPWQESARDARQNGDMYSSEHAIVNHSVKLTAKHFVQDSEVLE